MSRIGRKTIPLGTGVSVTVQDGEVAVKGPKGRLSTPMVPGIDVEVEKDHITVTRRDEEKQTKSWHGMMRALIANMVTGVTTGFKKDLEIVGIGYRAQMQGKKLILNLGYSNPVEYEAPAGVDIATDGPTKLSVQGIDKQAVGQVAAIIRGFRAPEPYQGKGIRYAGERIIRKAGKTGAK
ncbi:MAG: 50S ribosomal protein L6 [Synergistaceae bacterium]|jgi:large subunit ribosomal protein L6|uniref:50S ribosomal protein L6 n=1 Tax=Aminivibrio sp. TaxID=1872489 RepID=UPI00169029DA|nr:50S ribosomal protein L6 [Synergistaceae bacterium]NCC56083.1 50S ribosomal protein L6 [Synergistales bacterium]MDD3688672.1 50S ribosomal protein L6 [Synergistaceae bacterium]MDD4020778.1 50S ribosomal protein L6 [Synergistaceae bacterium]MDD4611592.1 50S ribosomal protein L6 [Synergistaceae bacterium]